MARKYSYQSVHLTAVENHKSSNQTVVKEKHAFIFYELRRKIKEENA